MIFFFVRRQIGKVITPMTVFCTRMPTFASFYGKLSQLDRKLKLPSPTAVAIREQVASLNTCHFCMDATRWYERCSSPAPRRAATPCRSTGRARSTPTPSGPPSTTPRSDEREEGRLETFARLKRHYSEREICEIVWLVASEHLYNLTNSGLNIGSDGLCELGAQRRASPRLESA